MFKRIVAALFVALMVSSQLVTVAKADPSIDEPFYSSNDILFYDPRCDTNTAQGEILTLNGKDNIDKIFRFLIAPAQGLTVAQAAGVIGNLMAESGDAINPAIIQGGGTASPDYKPVSGVGFGIAQWTFPARQDPLVQYMRPYNDITNLDGQVGFLWAELNGTHAGALRQLRQSGQYRENGFTTEYEYATYLFHKYYEGSADSHSQVVSGRGGKAKLVFDHYADAEPPTPESDSTASSAGDTHATRDTGTPRTGAHSCTAGPGGGDLISLVQAYAWPEYKGSGQITPTDAYRDAVQAAIGQKRYVGGQSYPGIDCGGFVTTLIVDSGFDKAYNYDGKGGYTVTQEQWLKANWKSISATDPTDRQPGDVAINGTHTYIFVGPDAFANHVPIASASLDDRAPMQGRESVADSSFRWYRKPITPPSTSIPAVAGGGGGSW